MPNQVWHRMQCEVWHPHVMATWIDLYAVAFPNRLWVRMLRMLKPKSDEWLNGRCGFLVVLDGFREIRHDATCVRDLD